MSHTTDSSTKEQLLANLRRIIADAEELLAATSGGPDADTRIAELRRRVGESISSATDAVRDSLSSARERMADADAIMRERARHAANLSDEYVRDHPWSTIGAAAAAGLLIGVILSRR